MRATSSAPLRFVSCFSGFDRILGINTPVRILRFDDLRYDEVSEKMVLACHASDIRGAAIGREDFSEVARLRGEYECPRELSCA
jgi:hypothetical protein